VVGIGGAGQIRRTRPAPISLLPSASIANPPGSDRFVAGAAKIRAPSDGTDGQIHRGRVARVKARRRNRSNRRNPRRHSCWPECRPARPTCPHGNFLVQLHRHVVEFQRAMAGQRGDLTFCSASPGIRIAEGRREIGCRKRQRRVGIKTLAEAADGGGWSVGAGALIRCPYRFPYSTRCRARWSRRRTSRRHSGSRYRCRPRCSLVSWPVSRPYTSR